MSEKGAMTLNGYFGTLRGYWVIILICTMFGGLTAALLTVIPQVLTSKDSEPLVDSTAIVRTVLLEPNDRTNLERVLQEARQYHANYSVLVSASPQGSGGTDPLDLSLEIAGTIAKLMSSDLYLNAVADGAGVDAADFREKVTVAQVEGTPFLDVLASGDAEFEARLLAQKTLDLFSQQKFLQTEQAVSLMIVGTSITAPTLPDDLPYGQLLEATKLLTSDFLQSLPAAGSRTIDPSVPLFDDGFITAVETALGLDRGAVTDINNLSVRALLSPVDAATGLETPTGEILISAKDTNLGVAREVAQLATEELQARFAEFYGLDRTALSPLVITGSTESVVTTAVAPKSSLLNNTGLGLLLGLLAGISYAVWRLHRDKRIRSISQILPHTGMLPIGVVTASIDPSATTWASNNFSLPDTDDYRNLRSNLIFGNPGIRVVAVSSPTIGSGATSVAVNLASAIALTGFTVVIVEASARRERLASKFALESGRGMSDVLNGRLSAMDAIQVWAPGEIAMLSAGTPVSDPSELVSSERFVSLLAELRSTFDYVLCVTGPVLETSDAAVVARRSDGVLLVVRYERTTTMELEATVTSLMQIAAPIAGVVVTDVPAGETLNWKTASGAPLHLQ